MALHKKVCFKCPDHTGTCRASCQKWKDEDEAYQKERAEFLRKKRLEDDYNDFKASTIMQLHGKSKYHSRKEGRDSKYS